MPALLACVHVYPVVICLFPLTLTPSLMWLTLPALALTSCGTVYGLSGPRQARGSVIPSAPKPRRPHSPYHSLPSANSIWWVGGEGLVTRAFQQGFQLTGRRPYTVLWIAANAVSRNVDIHSLKRCLKLPTYSLSWPPMHACGRVALPNVHPEVSEPFKLCHAGSMHSQLGEKQAETDKTVGLFPNCVSRLGWGNAIWLITWMGHGEGIPFIPHFIASDV